jgi:energy-converting hydrogenase Eha subunit C
MSLYLDICYYVKIFDWIGFILFIVGYLNLNIDIYKYKQ